MKWSRLIGLVLSLYLVAPVVAGILNYWDHRGPKIYIADLHQVLYGIGGAIAGRPEAYTPVHKRTWFYGGRGELMDFMKRRRETPPETPP